jgi:pimeloyl-ACP methyl ester carboxylesterase
MSRLPGLNVPTCLITGGNSYMLDHVKAQQQLIPGATLEIIPEVSHFIPQENPDEVAALINRFFATS